MGQTHSPRRKTSRATCSPVVYIAGLALSTPLSTSRVETLNPSRFPMSWQPRHYRFLWATDRSDQLGRHILPNRKMLTALHLVRLPAAMPAGPLAVRQPMELKAPRFTPRPRLMNTPAAQLDLLKELEVRHEELIVQLDELDKRVEKTLAECQVYRIAPSKSD